MNRDLTVGKPGRKLMGFALPMLLSVVFQQLYNMADSAVVGQFEGKTALAAVGASYTVTLIFIAIAMGLSLGISVVASQLFGSKHYASMKTAIRTSILFALGLALVLTVVGRLLSNPLLHLLRTDAEIMEDSAIYLNIYIYGLCFLFLYNICTGIFTAMGDSRTPLFFLICSSLGNIGVDILFVAFFHMGVAGVAWATFLCQGVCSLMAFIVLMARLRKISCEKSAYFSLPMLWKILYVSIPSILQQSFVAIGNVFVQGLVNSFGVDTVAAYSASIKLNNFAINIFCAFGNSVSSFTAQNMGAKRIDRVKQGVRVGLLFGVCIAAAGFLMLYIFAPQMVSIFMEANNAENLNAIRIGVRMLRILTPFYLVIIAKIVLDGVLRGSGEMVTFTISTFADLLLRVGMAFILSAWLSSADGIWYAWPVGWTLGTVLSVVFFLTGRWKNHTLELENSRG